MELFRRTTYLPAAAPPGTSSLPDSPFYPPHAPTHVPQTRGHTCAPSPRWPPNASTHPTHGGGGAKQAVVGALGTSSSSSSTGAARALAAATSAEQQGNGNTTTTTKAAPVGRGWRVLFFGSDEISLATLDLLLRHHLSPPAAPAPPPAGADALGAPPPPPPRLLPVGVEALEVVTGVDKVTSARSVPVKQFALRTGLPLHQPPRLKEWAVPLTKDGHAFDIGVVVSFGHFIPPSVLDALPWGAINMHPSLLPRHTYPPLPQSIHPPTNQPASQPASQ
ncbi:Methionyl-tRNA formyltransferase [Acanthamoeba castellanii str. Neff]|uniref:Methionyl-tRNA formyltransferase n=1 Tax=Acanthamoeba castellanii (strain ATCC 30010 / Neff) TaxID=1257118 RepID=L8GR79_ACACF|nr:Methionyl-tRNA formyltransferase [Acanthamoeba castellanii str. Neff]ELR15148.1 Methionyl-tRNA formyltransferase [Acanthamoeba castellanii str. Neff]